MKFSTTTCLLYFIMIFFYSCNSNTSESINNINIPELTINDDSLVLNGTDELSSTSSDRIYTRSEYNEDLEDIENIERPDKSIIKNSAIDTADLFKIWVRIPGENEPHATFRISKEEFYVVDNDGDGSIPYILTNNNLEVFYNDFKTNGQIVNLGKDTLIIRWDGADEETKYETWKW